MDERDDPGGDEDDRQDPVEQLPPTLGEDGDTDLEDAGARPLGAPPRGRLHDRDLPMIVMAHHLGAHDARVEGEVALDAPAWHVEEVELPERRVVHGLSAPPNLRRPAR